MITYSQSTGRITSGQVLIGVGYSGHEEGLNNSEFENKHDIGPIPRGKWKMITFFENQYENKGTHVIRLEPNEETETFGRDGFLVHGDNAAMDKSASHGCIIVEKSARDKMWSDADKIIEVV